MNFTQIDEQLRHHTGLPEAACAALLATATNVCLPKKGRIARSAASSRQSFFVLTGAFRLFYLAEAGEEVTTQFFLENAFITNCDHFLGSIQPEGLCIEALEPATLLAFENDTLQQLATTHPPVGEIEALVVRTLLQETVHHNQLLRLPSPTDRYHALLAARPTLARRVSVGHLSSYLAIARETLSRVRAHSALPQ